MANLIPTNNNKTSGAIVKSDKFFASSSKKSSPSIKKPLNKDPKEDIILTIEKKVIKIDNLLKDSFALKKKQAEKARVSQEKKSFEKRESELEKKKPKTEKGIKLPSAPRMGFLDWIKNFITQTFLGFIAVRLIDFLPTLLKIYPVIISAGEFLIDVGGNLLNSLVSFVDWGYKAIDGTRQFIKNIGGEGWAQNFDKFAGAVDNLIEVAVIAALVTAGSGGGDGFGGKGVDPKKGFDAKGRRVGVDAQRRYAQRFGRDQFVDRFGRGNLGSLQGGARRGAFQQGARNAFVGLAGKGGAKSILKFVRPLTKRLPIIGGLLDFGLSVALGEDPGRAAFKAIGATLVGAVGAAIGSLAFGVGGIIGGIIGGIGGDALGGALYDMIFKNKKPTQKQGKVNKLAGGGAPMTRTSSSSTSTPRRTLKRKKAKRSLTFVPKKIKPGRSAGGEEKVQKVFPNPSKPKTSSKQPEWWDPFGIFTGGSNNTQQQTQETKPKPKTQKPKVANPQEFLIKSNEVLGRTPNFGPIFTLALKTVLGDTPTWLDYLNVGRGLNAWTQGIFSAGSLGFSGGGEVDAKEFFQGEDYTNVIAKSVKDSVSKDVDRTIRNLKDELSLRPVGKDEMIQENIKGADEESEPGDGVMGSEGSSYGSPEMKALLDVLAYAEGTTENRNGATGPAGYSTWAGYQIHGPTNLTTQTIQQVHDLQTSFMRSGKTRVTGSAVVGRYQFKDLKSHFAKQAGLSSNDLFSPENQDKMAIKEIERAGVTTEMLRRNGLNTTVLDKLAPIWASLPYSPKGGKSYYGQAYKNPDKLIEVYNKKLKIKREESSNMIRPTKDGKVGSGNFKIIEYITGDRNYRGNGRNFYYDLDGHGRPGNYHDHVAFATVAEKERAKRILRSAGIQIGSEFRSGDRGYHGQNLAIDIPGHQWGGSGAIGKKEFDGSVKVRKILGIRFHGGPISQTGNFFLHAGEYVFDKDSVDLFGIDLISDINSVENKSQLIARAPSIIEKLKTISNYTDDESENQVVFVEVPAPPEIVPIGSSGNTNIFVGGVNSDMASFDMEQKLSQIG